MALSTFLCFFFFFLFFVLLISADCCDCTVRIYTYGRRVKSNASMFIDRLQKHSTLEYWSISVCKCSGETVKVETLNFKEGHTVNHVFTVACRPKWKISWSTLSWTKVNQLNVASNLYTLLCENKSWKKKVKRKRDGVETLWIVKNCEKWNSSTKWRTN